MAAVGIVAEYDPFHRGHSYQIAQTRRALGEDVTVICAMSGNWVQRGGAAIADKWRRAAWAVRGGADLVVELPTVWAASSAERFALGGVSILRMAGVQALSFGSEGGEEAPLRAAAACLESEDYRAALREYLDRGLPFALCRQRAAEGLLGREGAAPLGRPNDNLGVEYLRAAAKLGWDPEVVAVPRRGAGHNGGDHPVYPSASQLRRKILAGELPLEDPASLRYNERGVLSRLREMSREDFDALPDCGEGLSRRLYRASRLGTTLEEVYALAKTKRYAHARIRRAVLWGALGLTAADREETPGYLRVLAMSRRGAGHLARLRGSGVTVITKSAKFPELLAREARCTDFYALCRKIPGPCGEEFRHSPAVL